MTELRHIAVIDIGKTNAKLAVVDLRTLTEVAILTTPNIVIEGPPWPHFDTEGLWSFLLGALRTLHALHRIDAISVTTHGACAALLGPDGTLAAPVLDYEHDGPDALADAYDAIRPPFTETGSPRLPMGLNLGAQLHWQFETDPTLHDRTRIIVTWPQYWSHRLTGITATDVTSLGCHTDLWNPWSSTFSALADRLKIRGKLAPALRSGDVLGPILPAVAVATGLPAETPVACGIHDSNASLYPHLVARRLPFAVVSTGTWVICMAVGGMPVTLDPARDTLINVNALGLPVPSARFMGGREFDLIRTGSTAAPTRADCDTVVARNLMLLPAVEPRSGPFPGHTHHWSEPENGITEGERMVALAYYLALVTAECLSMTGADGTTVVEGPFSRNTPFVGMLATATGRAVIPSPSATGTSLGAALLFAPEGMQAPPAALATVLPSPDLAAYASGWRMLVSMASGKAV
jgi:sugar (pentulose or hexulose) kinase